MSPKNATEDSWGNRQYTWPATGETFRSVTTILGGGVPKNGLPYWAAKEHDGAIERVRAGGA